MVTLRNPTAETRLPPQSGASHQPEKLPERSPANGDDEPGDILYGAKAIARYLFGNDDRRTCRRVFNLWSFYQYRKEKVGLFKLKGGLCLSKSQWRAFRG